MARYVTPPGRWGKITRVKVGGKWRARARMRDETGKTRQMEAWGTTAADAQRKLEDRLHESGPAAGGVGIHAAMTLDALATEYLAEAERLNMLAPQTLQRYRWAADAQIRPGVGQLRLQEATVGRMDKFLAGVYATSLANGKLCRAVLSNMFGLALRHDAMSHNPIRDVARAPRKVQAVQDTDQDQVEGLTMEAVHRLREDLQTWLHNPDQQGQRRSADLPDVVDFMLATGCRIGEALAMRWEDIDLQAERPTATLAATVIQVDGKGLERQPKRKGGKGRLTATLPRFAVDMLLRRRVASTASPWVFPSDTGGLRSPNNWRRTWRGFKAEHGYPADLVPHDFRKAVATHVDREHGARDAAKVLGHSSPVMTEAHYIARNALAPDVSDTLQLFASAPQKDE